MKSVTCTLYKGKECALQCNSQTTAESAMGTSAQVANPVPFYSVLTPVLLSDPEDGETSFLLFTPSLPSSLLSLPLTSGLGGCFDPYLVLRFHFQLILGKKVNSSGFILAPARDSPPRAERSFEP